jgi:hypothetical protein
MSTAAIRRGHPVQGPSPVEQADPGAHGHRQDPGAGRGHYRGYVFRHPRSAAPPPTRRGGALRPRHPPGRAPQAGHEAEPGPALQRAGLGMPDLMGEQQGMLQVQASMESGLGERRDGDDEAREERQKARLRYALGRRPLPGPGPQDWLLCSGLPGVDVLCGPREHATPAGAARAAVQAMLGAIAAAATRAADAAGTAGAPGTMALCLSIQQLHLQRWPGRGGAPATLAAVKRLLMESAGPPQQRALPACQAQQNAHALAPVMALNLARPRTAAQRGAAMSRLELLGATAAWGGHER